MKSSDCKDTTFFEMIGDKLIKKKKKPFTIRSNDSEGLNILYS